MWVPNWSSTSRGLGVFVYQHLVALWAVPSAVKMGFLRLCG
jgi:hypothetical protein